MSEFKGTKGKWKVKNLDDIFINSESGKRLCIIEANGVYDYKEWRENAQLISCAPEMLEMLEKIVFIKDDSDLDFTTDSIKQLIKKATTI